MGTAFKSLLLVCIAFGGSTAHAADPAAPPAMVAKLTSCRAVADAGQRLACYDAATAELQQAIEQKQIVVIDHEGVRQTRRTLFGLSLPEIPFLSGDKDEEGSSEISSTVASAAHLGYGKWRIRLADGAVWNTLEAKEYMREPEAGAPVRIRRGAIGSYLMNIDGQRAVRVRRQN